MADDDITEHSDDENDAEDEFDDEDDTEEDPSGEDADGSANAKKAPKKRSIRNIPRENLEASIGHITKMYTTFGKELSVEAFADLIGHESTTSGPFKRKLGAVRAWGLVQEGADPLRLSDIGLAVVRDDQPDVQADGRRRAFLASPPFAGLLETFDGRELPTVEGLATRCKHAFRLRPPNDSQVANIFISSARFAGLVGQDGVVRFGPSSSAVEEGAGDEEPREEPPGEYQVDEDVPAATGDAEPDEDGLGTEASDRQTEAAAATPSRSLEGASSRPVVGPPSPTAGGGPSSEDAAVEIRVRLTGYSGREVVEILRTIGYRDAQN